ncbi:MAG: TolC family protein [Bdellovibrionota bacterium]
MRSLIFRLMFGVLTFGAFAPCATFGLTLREAQELARTKNPQLHAQIKESEANEASVTRSLSAFYPSFGVQSRYEVFDSAFERRRGGTGNFFAEWNVFNGLKDYAAHHERIHALAASKLQLEATRQRVDWDVEETFYRVIYHQDVLKLLNEAIARNQNQIKAAKSRRGAGVGSEADVLEFDLYDALLRSDLATFEGQLTEAQTAFRLVLGDDSVKFPLVGEIGRSRVAASKESVLGRVKEANVEVKIAELEIDEAQEKQRVATAGFLPQVKLFATYGSRGLRETVVNPETYAGVVARWELFSGFDTIAARREAQARLSQAETSKRTLQISTVGKADQVFTELKAIEFRVGLEARNLKGAERYFRVVLDEYRRGVKNSPDVKSASEVFFQALLRDVEYRYKFIAAKVELQKLMNAPIATEPMPPVQKEG